MYLGSSIWEHGLCNLVQFIGKNLMCSALHRRFLPCVCNKSKAATPVWAQQFPWISCRAQSIGHIPQAWLCTSGEWFSIASTGLSYCCWTSPCLGTLGRLPKSNFPFRGRENISGSPRHMVTLVTYRGCWWYNNHTVL